MKTIALLLSFFTSTILLAQQTQSITITSGGIDRNFLLYVPSIYDAGTPAPLIFCFHGYGSSASVNLAYTGFRAIADTAGFILIHPQGTLDATNTPHWNVGWGLSTVDDVGFTQDMIDYVEANYNLNTERIYSTGMSNGGFMSYVLACELSNEIAAIASVTGSMSPPTASSCSPTHPTPVLQIHGTNDPTVPYEGAIFSQNIDDVMAYWVDYNNCNPTPSQTPIPDINTGDGTTVDHFVFDGGTNGTTVELFKVYNGEHDWPGAFGNLDISSNIEIWKFFSKYDKNGAVGIDEIQTYEFLDISPNPVIDLLNIVSEYASNEPYEIVSALGKTVMNGVWKTGMTKINVAHLNPGSYIFRLGTKQARFIIQ